MRKLLLVAGLLLAFPLVSLAQDAPKAEIFGGYSYLNPKDGDDLHGWNASVTGNINKWFGLKADFSGYYDTEKTAFAKFSQSNHLFLAGGQFTYRKNDRVQPFAHLMAGTAYSRFKSRVSCPPTPTTVACNPFNGTAVTLTQGQAYKVAFTHEETGGGSSMGVNITIPGGAA